MHVFVAESRRGPEWNPVRTPFQVRIHVAAFFFFGHMPTFHNPFLPTFDFKKALLPQQ